MMVLGLISSPFDPASRARIAQFGPYLEERNVSLYCKYFKPLKDEDPKPWTYRLKKITGINEWRSSDLIKTIGRMPLLLAQTGFDLIWQNRLIQLKHSFWEKKLTKPVIFDFDDAIWLNEGREHVEEKMKRTEMIFAGNEYLAEFASAHNKNVKVVPTVVDTRILFPKKVPNEKFTIGWIGTESNFRNLEPITPILLKFLSKDPRHELSIVSSVLPGFLPDNHPQLKFTKWIASKENDLINQFSVGIMPLPDNEWTRGKCGYKLLQYLACGIPAIASPVGVNKSILEKSGAGFPAISTEDWMQNLDKLASEPGLAAALGNLGPAFIERNYSCTAWIPLIIEHMKSLL